MREMFNGLSEDNKALAIVAAALVTFFLAVMACVTASYVTDRLAPPVPAAEPTTFSPERVDIVIKR